MTDTSQAHQRRTRRRRRDWATGEKIALAEQARFARIQSATNQRDLKCQTTRVLRMDGNAYWKAIAIEYDRANQGFLTTGEQCNIKLTFQLFEHKQYVLIA